MMRLAFGDSVEISHMNLKGFVIGEAPGYDCQVVIIANSKCLGLLVDACSCHLVAAGFHAYATELREKYLVSLRDSDDIE
jgi:hypothetical protein